MKKLIYDCEVYPNYFLCLVYDIETKIYHSYELGKTLLDDIILNDEITLIGWNNHSYDDVLLKYIQNSALNISSGYFKGNQQPATEQRIYELSNEIINVGWDSTRVRDLRWQESTFDTMDVKSVLDPMPSLKKTEIRMRYKQVEDLPYVPGTILTEPEKANVQEYCYNDVGATFEVYDKHAIEHIKLREYLASRFNLDKSKLRSLSEAKTAEYILSQMACRTSKTKVRDIRKKLETEPVHEIQLANCIPDWITFNSLYLQNHLRRLKLITLPINAATGYADGTAIKKVVTIGNKDYQMGIGGLHSIDGPYQWRPDDDYQLLDADVTSYYPSILLRDGLYPRGYSSVWVDTYRHIYDTRLKAKQAGNLIEANALKIVLNATFGKLGSIWSSFYDPQLLVRVTLTGQLGLLMLIEKYAEEYIEVISANTDGVIVKVHNNKYERFGWRNLEWQDQTKMNLEYTYYNQYARRDVNNYTALTTDNKVKNKGAFAPPDLRHDVQAPIIQKMVRAKLLYNEDLTDYLEDNLDELDIYDFLFSFTATKVYDIFIVGTSNITMPNEATSLSRSNRWYISAKPLYNKLVKTGGKLGNTISVPNGTNIVIKNHVRATQLPTDLDYSYYIAAANKLLLSCEEKL